MDDIIIPKDFKTYEPKLIGNFTVRQSLLLGPSIVLIVFLKNFLILDLFIIATMLIFSIVWAFGWFKPYNMKFEKFLTTSLVKMFLSPKKRKYKTMNIHRVSMEAFDKREKKKRKSKKGRKQKNGKKEKNELENQ